MRRHFHDAVKANLIGELARVLESGTKPAHPAEATSCQPAKEFRPDRLSF